MKQDGMMGQIVQAAKITHVPSIWMSHTMEKYRGIRQSAIDGLRELGRRARASGVETFIVFDTHWIVNQGFHCNAKARHEGVFTSHELPHMLSNMAYGYDGDPELAKATAAAVNVAGIRAIAHDTPQLACEYGTLVPMHFMNEGGFARVLPVAANQFASIEEGRRMGAAVAEAAASTGRNVSILASGSMSHAFWPNAVSADGLNSVNGEFNRQVDLRVIDLWRHGQWSEFLDMLPDYARLCSGECAMIDTAMLFGALGWKDYRGSIEILTPYFGSSGTGQTNISFGVA
jgi:3,4-dihydroxyphenylacetate 2,3-dioxygenase